MTSRLTVIRTMLFLMLLSLAAAAAAQEQRTQYFPRTTLYTNEMPPPGKVWLFVLAGQSNMAGRGLVEPADTVPDSRILFLTPDNRWAVAKEPLQLYQPAMTGLGPGMAFARALREKVDSDIIIGLVPCAVGGSSTTVWLSDSLFNGVRLKSNLIEKMRLAQQYGTIKGVIWHQGESDATPERLPHFRENTLALFSLFRDLAGNPSLPVVAGELGLFRGVEKNRLAYLQINDILASIARDDPGVALVRSFGVTPMADRIHFDGPSQRMMGRRYAAAWLRLTQENNR